MRLPSAINSVPSSSFSYHGTFQPTDLMLTEWRFLEAHHLAPLVGPTAETNGLSIQSLSHLGIFIFSQFPLWVVTIDSYKLFPVQESCIKRDLFNNVLRIPSLNPLAKPAFYSLTIASSCITTLQYIYLLVVFFLIVVAYNLLQKQRMYATFMSRYTASIFHHQSVPSIPNYSS